MHHSQPTPGDGISSDAAVAARLKELRPIGSDIMPYGGQGTLLNLEPIKSEHDSLSLAFLNKIAGLFHAEVFVETGTLLGGTTAEAAKVFREVHTIELSRVLFQKASQRFQNNSNVRVYHGDSAVVLQDILPHIRSRSVFWLDGHYSGGETALGSENTPIIQEIQLIRQHHIQDAIILIDDIRCFYRDPNPASILYGYPTIRELFAAILEIDRTYCFEVIGDVAIAYPARDGVQVSSVVRGCTISRFSDESPELGEALLEAEQNISRAKGIEQEAIRRLAKRFGLSNTADLSKYYALWIGLILYDRKQLAEAIQLFTALLSLGFNHWRIQWYLARAAYESGNMPIARASLLAVLKAQPDFKAAQELMATHEAGFSPGNMGAPTEEPAEGSARPRSDKRSINIVYGHLRQEDTHAVRKANISIIWSSAPIQGCDVYVYHNAFSYRGRQPGLNILLMLEPAVVLPGEFDDNVWRHFDYVLTLFDALTERGNKFRKIFFPHFMGKSYATLTEDIASRRRLYPTKGRLNSICMINGYKQSTVPGELYSRRVEIARWFHDHSTRRFDVYGNPPFPLPNYKGALAADAKLPTLKKYKYCLCFENTDHPLLSAGYITEKILDCLETRTVPIYLGASNIEKYIPVECFIDYRQFSGFKELDDFLKALSDEHYENYITSIDAFVANGGLRKYSSYSLNDAIVNLMFENDLIGKETAFGKNDLWVPETRRSLPQGTGAESSAPVMWTWNYLRGASSPLLAPSEPADLERTMRGGAVSHASKVNILSRTKSIQILYVGMKFAGGNAARGYDPSWWNIQDAFRHFTNIQVTHFDYMLDAGKNGVIGMSDNLLAFVRKNRPDVLILNQNSVPADTLREAIATVTRQTDTVTLAWMSDDHQMPDDRSTLWAPCLDYIITTADASVIRSHELGFADKIIKSQWACNPYTYFPTPVTRRRDVSFIGTAKDDRAAIINTLRDRGLNTEVFGWNWPGGMDIPLQDMVRIFSESRINLNITSLTFPALQHVNARTFEVPGCRGFLMTTPAEGLESYYIPDKEIVVASSIEELVDKAHYYLSHDAAREAIAERGYERTSRDHTWAHRVRDIFSTIGFHPVSAAAPAAVIKRSRPSEAADNISVSISVCAYNNLEYTKLCVGSILHFTPGEYELLLTDNGSTDGTLAYFESVKAIHPHTRVIKYFRNNIVENVGNYYISLSRGTYFVGMTNDLFVHERWLENFIDQIDAAENIGMVGPRSNSISGPQFLPCSYQTLEEYEELAEALSRSNKGRSFPLDRMVGMCYITKKKVFERIGGVDPELPTNGRDGGYGFSDDDLSVRLKLAGYRMLAADDVLIHHYGSKTVSRNRPDIFEKPQNINMEKYRKKLLRNPRVSIGKLGEVSLKPYGWNEPIPVEERMVIRRPHICIVMIGVSGPAEMDVHNQYADLKREFLSVELSAPAYDIASWLQSEKLNKACDIALFLDARLAPNFETVRSLLDTALSYPDVAILVPVGDYAPSTHATPSPDGVTVGIIPYADLSICAMHLRLVRPCLKPLTHIGKDEDPLWFLQRRVRGDGYFIAKANKLMLTSGKIPENHVYDAILLPEQLVLEKRYAEATAIYTEDLRRDPAFVESRYQRACILREEGHVDAAIQQIEKILKTDPHHIESYVFLSTHYLQQGPLSRAEQYVRLANLKQPGNSNVQHIVAEFERRKSSSLAGTAVSGDQRSRPAKPLKNIVHGLVSIILRISSDLDSARKTLQHIQKHTPEHHELIFVVPSASSKAIKWARQQRGSRKDRLVVENGARFARDVNLAVQEASGEFILILNNDILVTEGWLSGLQSCLRSVPDSGIVGPLLYGIDGPQQVVTDNLPGNGGIDQLARNLRLRNMHRRLPARNLDPSCLLFLRDLFAQIGPFDEAFETDDLSCEDYCLRSLLLGHDNMICGDVLLSYAGGKAGSAARRRGNRNTLVNKWSGIDAQNPLGKKLALVNTLARARELYDRSQTDQAFLALLDAIKAVPADHTIYHAFAELLIDSKQFKHALDILDAMPGRASDVKATVLAGYCKEGLELLDEAVADADRTLASGQWTAMALNLKGLLAFKQGDRLAARDFFQKAIDADPGFGEPYTNLGVLQWSSGERDMAIDHLERGFVLSPILSDIVTLYFSAITEREEFSRAEQIFAETKALHPANRRIAFILIEILLKQGKHELAMHEIEQAMIVFGIDDGLLDAAIAVRHNIGPLQIAKKSLPIKSLSLCMIVKNEQKHLARCLHSIKPVVDEMIVVDTGSSDRTKDIATAFGAKVFDFPWTGDFSAARNYSLTHAAGDWILVLDADEVIAQQDHEELRKLISKRGSPSTAYDFVTRNYIYSVYIAGWIANDGKYPQEEAGTGWAHSVKVRLFPRDARITFVNPVHELVEPALRQINISIRSTSIPIHHYGKLDPGKDLSKGQEYYELGRKKLEENGDNLDALRELALQAGLLNRCEEAVDLWNRVLKIQPDMVYAYINLINVNLQMDKFEDALSAARKALALGPDIREVLCSYALCEMFAGDLEQTVRVLEDLTRRDPEYPYATIMLLAAYLCSGRIDKGAAIIESQRLTGSSVFAEAIAPFISKLMAAGRITEAKAMLEGLAGKKIEHDQLSALGRECDEKLSDPRVNRENL